MEAILKICSMSCCLKTVSYVNSKQTSKVNLKLHASYISEQALTLTLEVIKLALISLTRI